MQQITVDSESGRCTELADEKPARYALRAARAPLREDLPANGREQHGRTDPADEIDGFHTLVL